MNAIDYEAEYNNRARVPEHPAIIASWARDAAAYRAEKPARELRYGGGERHVIDLFEAGAGPVVMFIHGGYWQATDRSFYSHLARGLNAHGISVAVPSYDLCPNVHVGEIVAQVRAACAVVGAHSGRPIIASGHSAGGHLAACMLATEANVPAAHSISGLFDLRPLITTSINATLGMNVSEAEALSPLFWPAPMGKAFDCVVGAEESGEYHRQSRVMAETWGKAEVATRYDAIAGANHFTVIAPLADPASSMCARLKQLAD